MTFTQFDPIFIEEKHHVFFTLTASLLQFVDSDEISEEFSVEISKYLLRGSMDIADKKALNAFCLELVDKYSIFSSVVDKLLKEKKINRMQNIDTQENIQKLENIKTQLSQLAN